MKRIEAIPFGSVLFGGCAATGGGVVSAPIRVGLTLSAASSPAPQACDGAARVIMTRRGGTFAIPKAGWAGKIGYGPAVKSHWVVTSSVTNNSGAPAPPSGTPIFYMRVTLNRPGELVVLGSSSVAATVTSRELTAAHTYTVLAYDFVTNSQCPSPPCLSPWTLNIGSPQSGQHSITFASPLQDASVESGSDGALLWQFVQN